MARRPARPPAKPVIGVTPNYFDPDRNGAPNPAGSYYLNRPYVEAVKRAGGLPVAIPYLEPGPDLETVLDRVDGLLLTGGFDVDMRELGGTLHPKAGRVHPERLRFELDLCRRAAARDLPLLAVCLGLQTLNLAFGGGFHQHLPEAVPGCLEHKRPEAERAELVHPVELAEGSLLAKVMGARSVRVNSLHHQAAAAPGQGLVASGLAPDGVVEGMERPGARFCLGVQWHPEELQDRPEQAALFAALVGACR